MNRSDAVKLARQLRKNSTKPELQIWEEVRNRRLNGLKFTRQFPIEFKLYNNKSNFFIADFYCHQRRLIIEVDGDYHAKPSIEEYDRERDEILSSMGYSIIRFSNDEVLENIEMVKRKILSNIDTIS